MERITQLYRVEIREGTDWRKLLEAICSVGDHVSLYHLLIAQNSSGVGFAPFHPGLVFERCSVEPIVVDGKEIGFRLMVEGLIHERRLLYCVDAYYDGEGLLVTPCPSS